MVYHPDFVIYIYIQKDNKIDVPWNKLKAHQIDLKSLPTWPKYAFLGPNSTNPMIVDSKLNNAEIVLVLLWT